MSFNFKKTLVRIGALTLAVAAPAVFAEGTTGSRSNVDLSSLTNSVDFGTVLVGIMAVAGSLVALYAGSAGVRWILRMVRGA